MFVCVIRQSMTEDVCIVNISQPAVIPHVVSNPISLKAFSILHDLRVNTTTMYTYTLVALNDEVMGISSIMTFS